MQKRFLPIVVTAVSLFSIFSWNCTKLDTTDLGSDLLPAVDNVNTFADTLLINTTQGIFNDTTKVYTTGDFVLGAINNDPLFGKTNASVFLQLKPTFYPYYWGKNLDTIVQFDSIVLCLKYKGFWGDSTLPVQLDVREVVDNEFKDSLFKLHDINYQPSTGSLIGTGSVDIRRLGDTVKYKNGRDYSVNIIRIKLDQTWAQTLFNRDSSATPGNNAFSLDSIFRSMYNGLAVMPVGGGSNALMYLSLADTSTKLEVHFKKRNKNIVDTVFQSLILNSRVTPSGTAEPGPSSVANRIFRNRVGASMSTPAPDELYLQTTPGSYVNLSIPGLSTLSNRIIHRAEIIVQQVPNNAILDDILSPPTFLYIDLRDSTVAEKWKPIYFDLSPSESYNPDATDGLFYLPSSVNYLSFGGYKRIGKDIFGNYIKYYNFNVTRYMQRLVTNHGYNYTMRMYAPYELYYPQLGTVAYPAESMLYGNNMAAGRVKVGGGNNANYRMMLRIVYSKL